MPWEHAEAGRLDEMSQGRLSLHIVKHMDGDLVLSIDLDGCAVCDENGYAARVEFCSTSGGGGMSPHTRLAIEQLFIALLKDNQKDPSGIPPYPIHLKGLMERQQIPEG